MKNDSQWSQLQESHRFDRTIYCNPLRLLSPTTIHATSASSNPSTTHSIFNYPCPTCVSYKIIHILSLDFVLKGGYQYVHSSHRKMIQTNISKKEFIS